LPKDKEIKRLSIKKSKLPKKPKTRQLKKPKRKLLQRLKEENDDYFTYFNHILKIEISPFSKNN